MEFNIKLTQLRKERKLLQIDVANKLEIGRATYGAYEQGIRQPDFDTLKKIADFFNVSIDYLLGNTDEHELGVFCKELYNFNKEDVECLMTIWKAIKSNIK